MKHTAKMQHRLHPTLGFLAANRVGIAWVHLEGGDSCCKTISPCIYHVRHLELGRQHRRELKDRGVFERVLAPSAHASDTKRGNTLFFSALEWSPRDHCLSFPYVQHALLEPSCLLLLSLS